MVFGGFHSTLLLCPSKIPEVPFCRGSFRRKGSHTENYPLKTFHLEQEPLAEPTPCILGLSSQV